MKSKSKPKRKALKKKTPADVEVSPQEETEDSSPPSKSKKRSKKADILTSTEVKVEPLEIKVESSGSLSLDIENEDVKPDLSIKDENPLVCKFIFLPSIKYFSCLVGGVLRFLRHYSAGLGHYLVGHCLHLFAHDLRIPWMHLN